MLRRKRRVDYTGKVLGLWTVIRFLGYDPSSSRQLYECADIFGTKRVFTTKALSRPKFGTHLYDEASIHLNILLRAIYNQIIARCYSVRCSSYRAYGDRGIRVCEEWLGDNGFSRYREWALANGWRAGLTIDRIDINGNYSPENCRFLTRSENAKYRRSTRLSPDTAKSLREDFSTANMPCLTFCRTAAKRLGVHPETIRAVIKGRAWN